MCERERERVRVSRNIEEVSEWKIKIKVTGESILMGSNDCCFECSRKIKNKN